MTSSSPATKENERLRAENDQLRADSEQLREANERMAVGCEQMGDEIKRLRAALIAIEGYPMGISAMVLRNIAYRALKQVRKE